MSASDWICCIHIHDYEKSSYVRHFTDLTWDRVMQCSQTWTLTDKRNRQSEIAAKMLQLTKSEVDLRRWGFHKNCYSSFTNNVRASKFRKRGETSQDHYDDQMEQDDDDDNMNPRELRALSFINPGKFMEDFDPERSSREMRKMNRRIYREGLRKNQLYDETGKFLDDSSDLCDCADLNCPGCHFPCPKCGSEKCGAQCRCNRQWIYEQIEIEGTKDVVRALSRDALM